METSKQESKLKRFKCNECGRILTIDKDKPHPCTACGHGTMRPTKPKAFCSKCGKPIYANVTPPNQLTTFYEKGKAVCDDYVDIICDTCIQAMCFGVQKLEKELRTDFVDKDDMEEKLSYYETEKKKIEKVEESDITTAKEPLDVKVKSLGERLKAVRKKLQWNQKELAEYLGIKSRRTIARYENDERKIPENIKDWIKRLEVKFDHQSKEQVKKLVKTSTDFQFMRKSPLGNVTEMR